MSSFFEIDFKKAQNYIEFQKEKNKDTMFNLKTKNNHEIKMQNSYQRNRILYKSIFIQRIILGN